MLCSETITTTSCNSSVIYVVLFCLLAVIGVAIVVILFLRYRERLLFVKGYYFYSRIIL